jgi:hypothetical protein
MHPYIQYQLADTRVADLRSQAEDHRTVQAARRARRTRQPRSTQAVHGPRVMLDHVLSALPGTYRQRRQPGTAAAQIPEGLRV